MKGVITQMGIGPARTVMIPGHVLAEAFIDGVWRYLDLDLRGVSSDAWTPARLGVTSRV